MKQYLPQRIIAQSIGGLYNQGMRTLAYWSVVNSVILLVLGWDSRIGQIVKSWFPWLTFSEFLIGVIIIAVVIMLVDLLFIFPAVVAFGNRQSVLHDNPIYDKLKKLDSMELDIAEIKKKVLGK